MRVLIVDDDVERSNKMKVFIKEASEFVDEVFEVISTSEAKEALKRTYIDVLILDVVLPYRPGGKAAASNGLNFLEMVFTSPFIRKPEKIIGITGHLDDIANFKEKFEEKCLTVMEVFPGGESWKRKLGGALAHTADSKISRVVSERDVVVVTVHGIRTFGSWQDRLKRLINSHVGFVDYNSYKYGFFSLFSFCVPFLRDREVRVLKGKLSDLISSGKDVYIFSHSFGTYLVAMSLRGLVEDKNVESLRRVVLSGSVLKRNFDWSFLAGCENCQVVNDCGDSDSVLLLSEAIVVGTGMAGRSGFKGFENKKVVNRFFQGGHSFYFDGDDFMKRFWVPMLESENPVESYDDRRYKVFKNDFVDQVVIALGQVKCAVYFSAVIFVAFLIYM
ncbi:response regulator receiver domain-containing protein [Halomonas ventosae]|uniref:Response regulator receiver domain-containing protein n=1 Tax=Halomonas ventosae TaxID=229007 RepID=A0A4R6ZP56_9GAMM|nr:response regulator [Halomonas ventosae]TDR54320.1 response regulator receiver domain-containing protein [Halomonas ventosae]